MTHRLTSIYSKNYCNRTLIVKVIIENVVTCFFGTQCSSYSSVAASALANPARHQIKPNQQRRQRYWADRVLQTTKCWFST